MFNISETIKNGMKEHQGGNLHLAEELYCRVLEEEPDQTDALHLLGLVKHQSGEPAVAVNLIQKAISKDPGIPQFYNNLGLVYLENGKYEEAINSFNQALRLKPDFDEAYNNTGNALHAQGENEKAVKYYQQAIGLNPHYVEAYNNIGVVLKETGRVGDAIKYYHRALRIKPDAEEIYFNLGVALTDKGELDAAIDCYNKAIDINYDYAEAYNNLGALLKDQGNLNDAIEKYRKALDLNPELAEAYNNLGIALNEKGLIEEGIENYKLALRFNPHFAQVYYNLGIAFRQLGILDAAIDNYQKAISLKSGYADAHWNYALALLADGKFTKGWKEYEWRFRKKDQNTIYPYIPILPRWNGLSFAGKRLLIHDEQGLGDTIQFVRYIPMVKALGGTVIFETRKPLLKILRGFPGIDELVERSNDKAAYTGCDLYMPLLSLPGILNTTVATIPDKVPYLYTDSGKKDYWQGRLKGDGFKVGLVWAGKAGHLNDKNRSLTLEQLLPLLSIDGISFYGLQKGDTTEYINSAANELLEGNFGREFKDFSDTAGIIDNLDLVISVDTAVAHLAGAMGKPVWTLLPFAPDWRWMLDRANSPWYPTMRLFRQKKPGDWDEVIKTAANKLSLYLPGNRLVFPATLSFEEMSRYKKRKFEMR